MLEDIPWQLPNQGDLVFLHPGQDAPGMPQPGCMAYLRESFSSRGVSTEASALLLSSWRPKTQSSYNSAFAKWASWCHERNRDPTFGPIEDVANFLSEFFSKGYQYRSLNSYRSAISAVHRKVDGCSVGQHPPVSRLLKGAFNERPPLSRYSSFWNVDVVLAHLKGLGSNGSLSLKTVISEDRPSRQLCLWHWHVLPGPQIWPAWTFVTNLLQMKALCFCPDIRPSKAGLRSLFRTSFTLDFQKMKSCVLYKLCWLMRIVLQLLGNIRGRKLFFFSHGLENMSQYPVVPSLDG